MTHSASFVALDDPETCWRDPDAKSIGYFAKRQQICLTRDVVEQIKRQALGTGVNARLSLHTGPADDFHEMIIFQHRDQYYRPKKHIRPKSFHMIEGEMAVFVFADDGSVIDAQIVNTTSNLIYRVGANLFHTDVPLTPYVVHHESTLGPFLGKSDHTFAPFSPPADDTEAYLKFRDGLLKLVGR